MDRSRSSSFVDSRVSSFSSTTSERLLSVTSLEKSLNSMDMSAFECCLSFGKLYFPDKDNTALFVTVPLVGDMKGLIQHKLLELLGPKGWNIKPNPPALIASIDGGTLSLDIKQSARRALMQELIETVVDLNGWLVSSGIDKGVSKFLGQARFRFASNVPTIGIGCIPDYAGLQSKLPVHDSAQHHQGCKTHLHINYISPPSPPSLDNNQQNLNPEHSLFFFVDRCDADPSKHDQHFRILFENAMQNRFQCASVCFIFEGDVMLFKRLVDCVEQGIALILFQSSGGAADILAAALSEWTVDDQQSLIDDVISRHPKIYSKLQELVRKKEGCSITAEEAMNQIASILVHKELLNVFDISKIELKESNSLGLRHVVISAGIKQIAKRVQADEDMLLWQQLRLAIKWKHSPVLPEIFNIMKQSKKLPLNIAEVDVEPQYEYTQLQTLQRATLHAMRSNCVDFAVKMWAEGSQIHRMFDVSLRLQSFEHEWTWLSKNAYLPDVIGESSNLVVLSTASASSNQRRRRSRPTRDKSDPGPRNNEMLLRLFSPVFEPSYVEDRNDYPQWYELVVDQLPFNEGSNLMLQWKSIWSFPANEKWGGRVSSSDIGRQQQEIDLQAFLSLLFGFNVSFKFGSLCPIFDLMVWAIVFGFSDMAFMFWLRVKFPVFSAVVGAALCRKIAEHSDVSIYRVAEFLKLAIRLEEAASTVLRKVHKENPITVNQILERKWRSWKDMSALDIALFGNCSTFLQQNLATVRSTVISRWVPGFRPTPKLPVPSWIQIGAGLIFPPFVNVLTIENEETFDVLRQNFLLGQGLFRVTNAEGHHRTPIDVIQPNEYSFSYWQKLYVFYSSPLAKFCQSTMSFLFFLIVFSLSITPKFSNKVSAVEWISFGCGFAFLIEAIIRAKNYSITRVEKKASLYDVVMFTFYLCGFMIRLFGDLHTAKFLLSLAGIAFYVRVLSILVVIEQFGPLLMSLSQMTNDMIAFTSIMAVVVLAFGITFKGILVQENPNTLAAQEALWRVYWNLYGKLFESDIMQQDTAFRLMYCAYMVLAVIVLLTLLVAVLTASFESVRSTAALVWITQNHNNVVAAKSSSCYLPVPISLVQRSVQLFAFLRRQLRKLKMFGGVHSSVEVDAQQVFDALDIFGVECLHRAQLQLLIDGMEKIEDKQHAFVSSFIDKMKLTTNQQISRDEFCNRARDWVEEVSPDDPNHPLESLLQAMTLFESQWEREHRRKASEAEMAARVAAFEKI